MSAVTKETPFIPQTDDKKANSFGAVLGLILGKTSRVEAGQLLSIAPTTLSSIIHDNSHITKEALAEKNWRNVLATYFPETWEIYSALFEKHAALLENRRNQGQEPANRNSLGYALWQILGGTTIKVAAAAERLGIAQSTLSSTIHGHYTPSPRAVAQKNWYKILEEHYPEGWAQYGHVLKARNGQETPKAERTRTVREKTVREKPVRKAKEETNAAATPDKPPITHSWKSEAALFVARILQERGDEIADIVPDASQVALRKPETWSRITSADETLSESVYTSAIRELCRLYELKTARVPKDYRTAEKLLDRAALN